MDCWGLRVSIWVLLVLNLVCCSRGIDEYYVNCGSSSNVTLGNITYVADRSASRFLSTPQDILADSNSNSISPDSPVYRTARIFTGPSRYTFPITQSGRHWIRLHFLPFVYQTYNMSSASFNVFSQSNPLLTRFTLSGGASVREYSVNISTRDLVITFSPLGNSFAYVNALEVVSVPDGLIRDAAELVSSGTFTGLVNQAFETVARVNMGGPLVSLVNDTLGRTWVSDYRFLSNPQVSTNRSNIPAVQYEAGFATQTNAPPTVYGTCTKMNSDDNPNSNFNVTWGFPVDPGFQYLIRLHFCDIVSTAANELLFHVYIDTARVLQDFDLITQVQHLATAYYRDFVTQSHVRGTLNISIGPSSRAGYPDAFLSGVEIMKMNNSEGSLAGTSTLPSFGHSSTNVGMIVGVCVGVAVVVILVIVGVLFFVRRKRRMDRLNSKTWVPISINGTFSHTMGSATGTTVSVGSNMSYRIPFVALQEATNNVDKSWVIGVGLAFGKVYKGFLNDDLKVAVKRGNPRSQQGLAEFRTEIEMLSQFRHRHLSP